MRSPSARCAGLSRRAISAGARELADFNIIPLSGRYSLPACCGNGSVKRGAISRQPIAHCNHAAQHGSEARRRCPHQRSRGAHFTHRRLIVELAETYSLPTMTPWLENVEIGGLIAYGPDRKPMYRYLASCVDKVLRRENPGEIPIYQSVSFKLAINLKTAKALGLVIPASVVARADEVVE